MNPAYAFFYMALGAGILLVADILAASWKLRKAVKAARKASMASADTFLRRIEPTEARSTVFQVMDGLTQREELLKDQIEHIDRIRGAR